MSDPVEDGRVGDIEEPLWVMLTWDPDDEEWVLSTNAAGDEPVVVAATALSAVLYRMAIGDLRQRD